jgi:glucose-6-phosphate-specific signal transduction histidine kinase
VERAAYYVVSEALANVGKHAGATRVEVTLRRQPTRLGVWVRDDGRGGATIAAGGGLGGLRDRVEALDGRLLLHSPAGGPTVLFVELPLVGPSSAHSAPPQAAPADLAATTTWASPTSMGPPPPPGRPGA